MTIPLFAQQIEKTTAAWNNENPILGNDVIGIETMSNGFNRFKRGNGVDSWKNLPYLDKIPPVNITAATLGVYTKTETDSLLADKFGGGDVISVANGGTGATTAAAARGNLGAAAANHSHSYLPLSGGTLTGNLTTANVFIPHQVTLYTKQDNTNNMSAITSNSGWLIFGHGGYASSIGTTAVRGNAIRIQSKKEIEINPYNQAAGYFIVGNSGSDGGCEFRPASDNYNKVGHPSYRFQRMYCVNGVQTSSDRRLKKNITSDLSALMDVMAEIEPVAFEYNDLNDGKLRFGFIAQDFEAACRKHGINPDCVAALQKDTIPEDSEMAEHIGDTTVYSLNYSEFIALNTAMIQELAGQVAELGAEVQALKNKG